MKARKITKIRIKLLAAFFLCAIVVAGTSRASAQCMNGWEWPEDEIFTPTCLGEDEIIKTDAYAGDYSVVAHLVEVCSSQKIK